MRTLITGAGGFVGGSLLRMIAAAANSNDEIVAGDLGFSERLDGNVVRYIEGGLDAPGVIEALTAEPFDRVYHLATVAGVGSANFDLGKATNLDALQALLEAIRRSGSCPRFVYSSSVGVFGPPLPATIDDDTLPVPVGSYGTHKLIGELLISDYTRAGFVDGLALRFPGIIARPAGSSTMLSAFLNNIFYAARDHLPFEIPLEASDGSWVMSAHTLLLNLIHAGTIPAASLPARRYWNLPALLVPMEALVAALARTYGADAVSSFSYRPDAAMRRMFAQVPLAAPGALSLGFAGDRDIGKFVENVIAGTPALRPRA